MRPDTVELKLRNAPPEKEAMNVADISRRDGRSPDVRRRDRGATLTEVLIAITLTGTLVVAVVSAILGSVKASSDAFQRAKVETVLLNANDKVNRAPQLCDYEQYVDAAALAEGWTVDDASVSVEILVANTGADTDWETQPCPADVAPFDVQRLTITVSDPAGRITESLTVVKSDAD